MQKIIYLTICFLAAILASTISNEQVSAYGNQTQAFAELDNNIVFDLTVQQSIVNDFFQDKESYIVHFASKPNLTTGNFSLYACDTVELDIKFDYFNYSSKEIKIRSNSSTYCIRASYNENGVLYSMSYGSVFNEIYKLSNYFDDDYFYNNGASIPIEIFKGDIDFVLKHSSYLQPRNAQSYSSIKNNDVIYNVDDKIFNLSSDYGLLYYDENEELDIPDPIDPDEYLNEQVFSIDYLIYNTLPNDLSLELVLEADRNTILDSIDSYSLYKENGLYTWRESDNCIIYGDYNEVVTANKHKITIEEVECDFSDGSISHYFKIMLKNAYNYTNLSVAGGNESFVNTYSDKHLINKFNTSQFKYLNVSTTKDFWNSYDLFYLTRGEELYIDYFDLEKLDFDGYTSFVDRDDYVIYQLDFGKERKRGFWLTYNVPIGNDVWDDFDFNFAFVPDEIYYQISARDGTRENNDAIIIDSEGQASVVYLEISKDITKKTYTGIGDFFKDLNNNIAQLNNYFNDFSYLFSYLFLGFNPLVQNILIALLILVLILGLVRWIKWLML